MPNPIAEDKMKARGLGGRDHRQFPLVFRGGKAFDYVKALSVEVG